MAPHQQRVVDEKRDLDEKIEKLRAFIGGNDLFRTLRADEQERLRVQLLAMGTYSTVLGERIEHFGD